MDTRKKIVDKGAIERRFRQTAPGASTLVIAKGFFDILRPEHCRRLAEARQPGTSLAVIVYADEDPPLTVLDERTRAELTAALAVVDAVAVCAAAEADDLARFWNPARIVDIDKPPLPDLAAGVLHRQEPDGVGP